MEFRSIDLELKCDDEYRTFSFVTNLFSISCNFFSNTFPIHSIRRIHDVLCLFLGNSLFVRMGWYAFIRIIIMRCAMCIEGKEGEESEPKILLSKQLINNSISFQRQPSQRHIELFMCWWASFIHQHSLLFIFCPFLGHSSARCLGNRSHSNRTHVLGSWHAGDNTHTFPSSRVLFHLYNGIRNGIPLGNIKVPRISFIAHCVCCCFHTGHTCTFGSFSRKSSLSFCQTKWKIASGTNFWQHEKTNNCSGAVGIRAPCAMPNGWKKNRGSETNAGDVWAGMHIL